ncbi:MAG: ROK family protein [Planctomycetota bacterium]|jgi:glucokinase
MTKSVIGIDLGGTKIAAALFPAQGEPTHREAVALGGRTGAAVGALLVERVRALLAAAECDGEPAAGVGIAVPGIYRTATETVWAPNIPGWDDYPLVAEVRGAVPDGMTVRVDSDRACAILGEAWRGGAAGARNAIFLAVGTGIGAGILVEGRIVRGVGDAAGAIGWLALDRPHREGYEAVGCFEYHASGPGIAAKALRLIEADDSYDGGLRRGDIATLPAQDVFAAYDERDPIAVRVLDEAVIYWGMAVANLVSLFNPETIIFGGGVFGPAVQFLERIREEAIRWAQPISIQQVALRAAQLGDDAVLYGAGRLALPSQLESPATSS